MENNSNNLNLKQLLNYIVTKDDADMMCDNIDSCIAGLYKVDTKPSDHMSTCFSHDRKQEIVRICTEQGINMEDRSAVEQFLRQLKDQVTSLPLIRVGIALDLPDEFLLRLSSWVDQHFEKKYLLQVVVDKGLIGGAQIQMDNSYYDFTLQKHIKDMLHAAKPKA
jgi:hypothetical protein